MTSLTVSEVSLDPDQVIPSSSAIDTSALWDTGATGSMISTSTVKQLALVPIGTTMLSHAGGSSPANRYLANFYLPNFVAVLGVEVTECPNEAGDFGAIIGMDIICKGDLAITNLLGQTWMTFRIPSYQHADFVLESDKITFADIPKNAPCPCGKTDAQGNPVKFKLCCAKERGLLE